MDPEFKKRLTSMTYPDLLYCLQQCKNPLIIREILNQMLKLNDALITPSRPAYHPIRSRPELFAPPGPVLPRSSRAPPTPRMPNLQKERVEIDIDELIEASPPKEDALDKELANLGALYTKILNSHKIKKKVL